MDLSLIEKRPEGTHPRLWQPFGPSEGFNANWWERVRSVGDSSTYLEVRNGADEVARVELGHTSGIGHYLDVPPLGDSALAIHFIEIYAKRRLQGVGTQVVRLLAHSYPERRLIAFSEEADQFWGSLGWRRHEHPDGSVPSSLHSARWVAFESLDLKAVS